MSQLPPKKRTQPLRPDDPEIWMNGRQALRLLQCQRSTLQRAALFGYIRVLMHPGEPPRYHRADVERYARDRSHLQGRLPKRRPAKTG
jgi:hypothetical protein